MSYCPFLLALLSGWSAAAPHQAPAAPPPPPAAGYVWPDGPHRTDASDGDDGPPGGEALPELFSD